MKYGLSNHGLLDMFGGMSLQGRTGLEAMVKDETIGEGEFAYHLKFDISFNYNFIFVRKTCDWGGVYLAKDGQPNSLAKINH